ncbi:MAG TPA: hypothetical protein VK628_04990 [Flavitalea sp.]|nr:hypothetical protein [Flavitalea sp.]
MKKTHRYILVALVAVLSFVSCRKIINTNNSGSSHTPTPKVEETEPAVLTPQHVVINGCIKGFYQAVPAHYHETNELYPVLICLPGGGQYGDGNIELPEILTEAVPKLVNENKFPPSFTVNGDPYSFIIIAPQFSREPFAFDLEELLIYVKANYRVDTSRIYMTGFSLGAKKTADFAAEYPYQLAAITAMGGAMNITEDHAARCKVMADAQLAAWQFHNVDDTLWDYHESERFVEEYNSFSPAIPARLTLFDIGQNRLHHDCWTRTTDPEYRDADGRNIYEWMLQYTR